MNITAKLQPGKFVAEITEHFSDSPFTLPPL